MDILKSQEFKEKLLSFFNFLIFNSDNRKLIQKDTLLLQKYYGINQKYSIITGKKSYDWQSGTENFSYSDLNTFEIFFILNKDTNIITPAINIKKDDFYYTSNDFINFDYSYYSLWGSELDTNINNIPVFQTPRSYLYYIFNDLLSFDFIDSYRDMINNILPQTNIDDRNILDANIYLISRKVSLIEFFALMVNYLISKDYILSVTLINPDINKSLSQTINHIYNIYTEPYSITEVSSNSEITILNDINSENLVNNSMVRLSYVNNKILNKNSSVGIEFKNTYNDLCIYDIYNLLSLNIGTFTQFGISDKINTNLMARDFQTSKIELLNLITTYYPEISNDFYNSSVGSVFIDLLSYLHDIQSNYIDRAQRESLFSTMLESNRIREYVSQFGYPINYGSPASFTADVVVDKTSISNIELESGDIIKIGNDDSVQDLEDGNVCSILNYNDLDLSFYLNIESQDVLNTINKNINLYDIHLTLPYTEGKINVDTFSALGVDGEKFTLSKNSLSDVFYVWYKAYNDDNWKQLNVSKYFDFENNKVDCIYSIDKEGYITLKFGNSSLLYSSLSSDTDSAYLGLRLNEGDSIKVISFSINKSLGNGVPQDYFVNKKIPFTVVKSQSEIYYGNFIIKSNSISYGGKDSETDSHIKKYFTSWINSNNRLVSEQDYNSFLNTYSCKYGSIGTAKTFLREYDTRSNLIYAFVLLPSTKQKVFDVVPNLSSNYNSNIGNFEYNDSLIEQLFEDINSKKMITDRVEIHNAFIQRIDFQFYLDIFDFVNVDDVQNNILKKLYEYFNSNTTFQNKIYVSEIQEIIQSELGFGNSRGGRIKDIKIKYENDSEYKSLQEFDDDMLIEFNFDKLSDSEKNRANELFVKNVSNNTAKVVVLLPGNISFKYGFKTPKKIKYDTLDSAVNYNLKLLE